MDVHLLQYDTVWEDKEANFGIVEGMLAGLGPCDGGLGLVCLPEMFATGFSMAAERIAEEPGGVTEQWLSRIALSYRCFLVGSVAERRPGGIYNLAVLHGPDGSLLGKFAKLHPFTLNEEDRHYAKGDDIPIFTVGQFRAAMFVCYDLRFPEVFREAAAKGAELFIVPANWPVPRIDHWRILSLARAVENQAYVLAVNRTGQAARNEYSGMSLVVAPDGAILSEGGNLAGVVSARLDYRRLFEIRTQLPFLGDIRADRYPQLRSRSR